MSEGRGIPGRPKGALNGQLSISWNVLCCDLRQMHEFKVPMDNEYIMYPIGVNEYIKISKIDNSKYQLNYIYNNLNLNCQILKNDNELDSFINKLIYEDYDFIISGFIKQFKVSENKKDKKKHNIEEYNEFEGNYDE